MVSAFFVVDIFVDWCCASFLCGGQVNVVMLSLSESKHCLLVSPSPRHLSQAAAA